MLLFVLGVTGLTAVSWTILAIHERLTTPGRGARSH